MDPLCALDDIDDPGSKTFVVQADGRRLGVFVVRRGDRVWGYVNSCPHVGSPLDWENGQVLDSSRTHLLCASHGALFEIETGLCLRGPCAGKALTPYPVANRNGKIIPCSPPYDI